MDAPSPSPMALTVAREFCRDPHEASRTCPDCIGLAEAIEKFAVAVGGKPALQRFACAICHVSDAMYFRRYGRGKSFRCETDKDRHPYDDEGAFGPNTRHKCQTCKTEWATQVTHGMFSAYCDACAPAEKITDEMRRG